MKVLCIDIGTGTQDLLLLDTNAGIENGLKMIVPSPTMIIRNKIRGATKRREPVLLTGVTMGGGPSHWAVEDHIAAGMEVYATLPAARSFNDDPQELEQMGIKIVSEDEARSLAHKVRKIDLKDVDLDGIRQAFKHFDVSMDPLSLIAAAVFDHGAAPPGYSDRKYRFEYIEEIILKHDRLSAFAYRSEDIPERLTRMRAVAASSSDWGVPLMLMDTAPAAVCGALLDPNAHAERTVVANIGNFHTLAFRLGGVGIEAVFEHHTGFMTTEKLDELIQALAVGSLTDEEVFEDQGHGARIIKGQPLDLIKEGARLVVVGPRRRLMNGSNLRPYFAAPFGDMMLVGCFGMLSAARDIYPDLLSELEAALEVDSDPGLAPWDTV